MEAITMQILEYHHLRGMLAGKLEFSGLRQNKQLVI
jgi:hypothetical protein